MSTALGVSVISAVLAAVLIAPVAPATRAALPTPSPSGPVASPPPPAPPSISGLSLSPNSAHTGDVVTVSAVATSTASTIVSADVSLDGGAWTPMSASDGTFDSASEAVTTTVTAPTDGDHAICVRATDASNLTSPGTDCVTLTVLAPPPPSISGLSLSPNTAYAGGTVTVSAVATSSTSSIVSADVDLGGAWTPMSASDGTFDSASEAVTATVTAPAGDGVYTICVRATDASNLTSPGTDCVSLIVSPSISGLSLSPNPANPGDVVTVSAVAASPGSAIQSADVSLDGGAWTPISASDGTFDSASEAVTAAVTAAAAGAHTICVRATDLIGLTSPGTDCVALTVPAATSTGSNVTISMTSDVTNTVTADFSTVTSAGTTTLTTSATAPALPGGFSIGGSGVYFDVTTTATYTGPITLCFSYVGITPAPTTLLHYDSTKGAWVDVMTSNDTVNQVICGTVASLSPFALAHPTAVTYSFGGFLQPINDTAHAVVCGSPCPASTFKGGSTIPVKFQLRNANGVVVQSTFPPQWVTPQKGGSTSATVDETVYGGAATSGTAFRWDGSEYIYNWSTEGLATGYFYRIGVTLDDGETDYVNVGLR